MIAREREFEKVQQKLYEEFSKLDLNQDGMITLEEIVEFLTKQVIVSNFLLLLLIGTRAWS